MAIDINNNISLDKNFFAQKTLITSKAGEGKSYFSRVLIEEGRALGNSFVVIDPQEAYKNLPDFEYINAENVKSFKKLGQIIALSNRNVVISTKRLTIKEQNKAMKYFLENYRLNLQKGIHTIIIDEGHKFAPENEKTESKEYVRGLFQENRSDGLGCFIISQRIQRLDKTIVSQCDNIACGRVISYRDKEAIKNYLENPKDINKFSKLKTGEFYLLGFNLDDGAIHKIRKAQSIHSGDTPASLLREDKTLYNNNSLAVLRRIKYKQQGEKKMTDIKTDIKLPTIKNIRDFGIMGMQIAGGVAVNGVISTQIAQLLPDFKIPLASNRTMTSLVSTLLSFALYRIAPNNMPILKNTLKYGTAGASAFLIGSLAYDTLKFFNVSLPAPIMNVMSMTTGVSDSSPKSVDNTPADANAIDLDSAFA
jgi:hypothetical protein